MRACRATSAPGPPAGACPGSASAALSLWLLLAPTGCDQAAVREQGRLYVQHLWPAFQDCLADTVINPFTRRPEHPGHSSPGWVMDRVDRWTEGGPSPALSQSLWTKLEDGRLAESHCCCRTWCPAPPACPPQNPAAPGHSEKGTEESPCIASVSCVGSSVLLVVPRLATALWVCCARG